VEGLHGWGIWTISLCEKKYFRKFLGVLMEFSRIRKDLNYKKNLENFLSHNKQLFEL
jgi:hypothetical protein